MINNNYTNYNNQKNNLSYGAIKDVVPKNVNEKLPQNIQNLEAKDIANNNGAVSTMSNMNKSTGLATLGIYLPFVALRTINDRQKGFFSFGGEYDKSFLGRLANFGNSINKGIRKLIPDNIETSVSKGIQSTKDFILKHSAIARSFTTPLKLESKMAMSEANGLFGRVMYDNAFLFEKGFEGDIRQLFKGDAKGQFWQFLLNKNKDIDSLPVDEAKEVITGAFREIAEMPVKNKETMGYVEDIISKLSQSNEAAVIGKWGNFPISKIPVIGKFFELRVPASEIANKLRVASNTGGKTAAAIAAGGASALGNFMPNAFAKIYEGFTSNYVGGKIAPVLQAYFLASAAMRAKDAPEGQRLSTFMDEEVGGVATLFTMPLATSLLTKMGGLKYLGMGKDVASQAKNVEKYREMIKTLNEKVDAKTITRGEYLNEVKKIKDLLNGKIDGSKGLRFWQKPLKAIGKILGSNYKKETIKPFIDDMVPSDLSSLKQMGLNVSNKVQNALYGFKTGKFMGMTPGGVLRFVLVMFVLSPIVTKPIRWAINKIFGKPYNPDEEKKQKEQEAIQNNPFANMQDSELLELLSKNQDILNQIQNNPELLKEFQSNPNKLYEILKEGAKKKEEANKNVPPSPILQQYINSNTPNSTFTPPIAPIADNQVLNNNNSTFPVKMPAPNVQNDASQNNAQETTEPTEPERTYIPSSKPADFSAQQKAQDEKFNAILQDMDNTEKEFSKYLSI